MRRAQSLSRSAREPEIRGFEDVLGGEACEPLLTKYFCKLVRLALGLLPHPSDSRPSWPIGFDLLVAHCHLTSSLLFDDSRDLSYPVTFLLREVRAAVDTGALTFQAARSDYMHTAPAGQTANPFHSVIASSSKYHAYIQVDPEFCSFRVSLSLLYWLLHSFGLKLGTRYLLCCFVKRVVEDIYQIRDYEVMAQIIQRLEATDAR